jgi:hypothetical protein
MDHKSNYSYKENYIWKYVVAVFLLVGGIIALVKWAIIPNALVFINWFVPNFWIFFGYILIIWFMFKVLSFFWSPVYFLLGKWSYLILIATAIYIIMQIN